MKRLIAVAVLVVIIATPCIIGNVLISQFEEELNGIMQQTYDAISRNDYEAASHLADEAERYFMSKEKTIAVFTDHELVENMGVALAKLPALASKETKTEFESELASTRIMLTHIVNDQRPVINNIL